MKICFYCNSLNISLSDTTDTIAKCNDCDAISINKYAYKSLKLEKYIVYFYNTSDKIDIYAINYTNNYHSYITSLSHLSYRRNLTDKNIEKYLLLQ